MALQNCGGIWTAAFVLLFIQSAVCKIIDSVEPASPVSDDDYGTELNAIEPDIQPGSPSVEYDEKGIWICPETFQLTFDVERKPFSIHLVRSPGTRSTKLPVFLSDGQEIWLHERKITRQYCNYQDIYTSSSFTITLEDSRYILDGTFRKMGKLFGIRPKEFSGGRVKRSTHDTHQHSLFLLSDDENFSETKADFSSRAKRDAKTRYEVEVLVVLDISVYERFQAFGENETTTEEKLAYHFSHVLNEVSLRFAGIDDQDYEIRIMMAGLLAAKTASGSPWTKKSVEKPTSGTVLKDFTYYLNEVLPNVVKLPNFDHAMLFVQYDMYSGSGSNLASGIFYRDSVCQYRRTMVLKNKHMFDTIFSVTQGLAINLGANYDGRGNLCSSTEMFLMSTLLDNPRTSENYWNIYKFSSCSKRELKTKLANMTRSNTCLLNTTAWDDTIMKNHLATPPGQVYSLDQQCQELQGPKSYFCGSQLEADQVCSRMLCWFPKSAACEQYHDKLAYEGTTCGDKKWCVKGKCLHNSNAPSADPNCIFGDTTQTLFGLPCSEVIKVFPYLCYNSTYRDLCCASCASIYQSDEVGCEYGDREGACQAASLLLCTVRPVDYCCKSCKNFRQPIVAIFSNNQPNNTNGNDKEDATTTPETAVSTALPEESTSMSFECGGNLTALPIAQSFVSPGYPIGYSNNQLCDWLIESEPGYRIWLNITDIDLEPGYNCTFDYVGLYRSGSASLYSRKKVCSKSSVGYNITSTENRLLVRFRSDEQVTKKGFAAEYKAVCGGLVEDEQGSVKSPGYPTRYVANINCTWTIKVNTGRIINATFQRFNLPGTNGSCGEDKVELFDGSSSSSQQLAGSPFCGTDLPGPFETTSRYLTLVFTTSSNPPSGHTGFSLAYQELSVPCGRQITLTSVTEEGFLASPNYPDHYPAPSDCVWVITSPTNTTIQLEFDPNFETAGIFTFCIDYVDVRDGGTRTSHLIGHYCGDTSPGTVLSSGNIIYVRFKADGTRSYQGFRLKYSVVVSGDP